MNWYADSRLSGWLRQKRVYVTLELIAVAILLGALAWGLRDVWGDAAPRLRHADRSDVALRRFGVRETPVVLASILLEAGLSAVAGVGVFLVGLAIIGGADVPLLPLGAFTVLVSFL